MDIGDYFSRTRPLIDSAMGQAFPRDINPSWLEQNLGASYYAFDTGIWKKALADPFYRLFDRGGKRIRPVLACLTHDALLGENQEIYVLSLIPEILHTGSLIVDDIQDNSELRRGGESIHIQYGGTIALNCGNFCYFYAQVVLSNSKLAPTKKQKISDILEREMALAHIGQGMDLFWSQNRNFDVDLREYLQMSAYKTGTLVKVAVAVGGVAAKANDEQLAGLYQCATPVGVAFQIQDDIKNLKLSGEKGKVKGEDITEGKLTFLVIDTLAKASPTDRKDLVAILSSKSKDESSIKAAIDIMEKYDAFTTAHKYAEILINDAKESAHKVIPDSEHKGIFMELLDSVVRVDPKQE